MLCLPQAAGEVDMRPSRMAVTAIAAELFVREFFDQNPLSQLSMGILRDGVAKLLTPLSGSPEAHIKALKANLSSYGDASLQNGLEMALEGLRETPSHGHREILILFSSLSTCDPGDITASLAACQNASVRCSVVGLAAEVFICRQLATKTGGEYAVALNEVLFCSPFIPLRVEVEGLNLGLFEGSEPPTGAGSGPGPPSPHHLPFQNPSELHGANGIPHEILR